MSQSKAALAVAKACEVALKAVLEKYPKRGDSWEEAFSTSTCFNLAGAKIKRIEMLLDTIPAQTQMSSEEITEEIIEEAGDAIAYIAFGMWKVDRI